MHSSSDLLEHLAALTGCVYLSDLRMLPPLSPKLCLALATTPAQDFSAKQWQEALSYLTGIDLNEDASSCRQRLLQYFCPNLPCLKFTS